MLSSTPHYYLISIIIITITTIIISRIVIGWIGDNKVVIPGGSLILDIIAVMVCASVICAITLIFMAL